MAEPVHINAPRPRGGQIYEFDQAVADAVCDALIVSDRGLYSLLASRPDLPAWSTINRWMDQNPCFSEAITRAREMRLERMADGLVELAGEARSAASAHEVQAVKLDVDTRKWMLSKLKADVYGDKLDLTSKGAPLAAPSHQIDARVQSIVMQAEMRRQASLSRAPDLPSNVEDLLG